MEIKAQSEMFQQPYSEEEEFAHETDVLTNSAFHFPPRHDAAKVLKLFKRAVRGIKDLNALAARAQIQIPSLYA